MEEHISPRGKEQNVRTLCRGPGKPRYTLPFRLTTHLSDSPLLGPPGVFCISPFTLPHALSDLCLSGIVLQ